MVYIVCGASARGFTSNLLKQLHPVLSRFVSLLSKAHTRKDTI